jgi:hypothetical protein
VAWVGRAAKRSRNVLDMRRLAGGAREAREGRWQAKRSARGMRLGRRSRSSLA